MLLGFRCIFLLPMGEAEFRLPDTDGRFEEI